MQFFKKKELNRFYEVAGKDYSKSNQEQYEMGRELYSNLYQKVNHWGVLVATKLDLEYKPDYHWITAHKARFKEYIWCRIYPDKNNKLVFFNVEVSAESKSFVIKLDCMFSGTNALSNENSELFYKYAENQLYHEQQINWFEFDPFKFSGWGELSDFSADFINQNMVHYRRITKMLKTGKLDPKFIPNTLVKRGLKVRTGRVSTSKKTNNNKEIDWEKIQRDQQRLGNAGEGLVIEYEKEKLNKLFQDKILKRRRVPASQLDGKGYDILSYDALGGEIHIEVKTTKGKANSPFFISSNEYEVAKKDAKWRLYRLFNYSSKHNSADFVEITRNEFIKKTKLVPKVYSCHLNIKK